MKNAFFSIIWKRIEAVAAAQRRTPENQVVFWAEEALFAFERSEARSKKKEAKKGLLPCLVPNCQGFSLARGLCPAHYPLISRWIKKGLLNEGWLIRHGRMVGTSDS